MKAEELERELKEAAEEKRKKKLAKEITDDFLRRREMRKQTENGWVLNMHFLSGDQYCDVSPYGGVLEEEKQFFWQPKRVFNHIAPMVDSRLAKLTKLRPELRVKAFSDEDGDLKAAKLATGIWKYVKDRIAFDDVVAKATLWSETCGTAFYKVVWDDKGGKQVAVDEQGAPVYEGEASVCAVSPFEIFPDRMDAEGLDGVVSLIHAQTVPVSYVEETFGVIVKGEDTSGFSVYESAEKPKDENAVILIERYTRPDGAFPNGKVEIVAGGALLYEGELPFENGERKTRVFPFVKQDCLRLPGAFFGSSVIERLIPVQRAYNAVRNRKHELLNRLSLGVITVEDGSVDTDELAEDGIAPGKILIYRQGGKAPEMLEFGNVPSEFKNEEEWLEREFTIISGVSDLSQNSMPDDVTSASGLRLLINEDETRLSVTTTNMEAAIKEVGKQVLRLYKQFVQSARLITLTGENKKTEIRYFNASDLSANDIIFEPDGAISPEENRERILTLLKAGLFSDDEGKITKENKNRILEAFGFGSYENARDISALHIAKAEEENERLKREGVETDEYDDHELHLIEHTRYLLSDEFKKTGGKDEKARFVSHMDAHKRAKKENENKIKEA